MKQRLKNFMSGRYGFDAYSRFLSIAALVLVIISLFMPDGVRDALYVVCLAILIYAGFRAFSGNRAARAEELAKYTALKNRIKEWFALRRDMFRQRREYKFFKCPSCSAVLRVPKGKGKLRIVCKKCGTAFEKKT